jgi:hypothetical protein
MDEWAKRRLAELETQAPAKQYKKAEPFALMQLGHAAAAFKAMNCRKASVWLWLQHQARKTGSRKIAVPNGALAKLGVSRKVKTLALQHLETAGLIKVEWRERKTPIATLL